MNLFLFLLNYVACTPPPLHEDADGDLIPAFDDAGHELDCDDNNADVHAAETDYYVDADGDGYGNFDTNVPSKKLCELQDGYSATRDDCDDADPYIHPNADDTDNDGIDDNCDGLEDSPYWVTLFRDQDGDGYGNPDISREVWSTDLSAELADGEYVQDNTDCDDDYADVHPAADEYCDGIDHDCDGSVNEDDSVDASTWYADTDGDTYGSISSPQVACVQPSGAVADATDCDDADAASYPGATEISYDGTDQDCDGSDFTDVDGDGYDFGVDCDDNDALINPDAEEDCDGVDNDCNGIVDDGASSSASSWYLDSDRDGYGDATTEVIACDPPSSDHVSDDSDCDDTDGAVNPSATEVCDTLDADEDCDGLSDDDDSSSTGKTSYYADLDGDGFGAAYSTCEIPTTTTDNTDCDDGDASVYPGASDTTSALEGLNSDCDNRYVDGPLDVDAGGITLVGIETNQYLGNSLGGIRSAGDLDGDGAAELFVAAQNTDSTATDAGSVYLLSNLTSLSGENDIDAVAAYEITGSATNDRLDKGSSAGDFDGDGNADYMAASSRASSYAGVVGLNYGDGSLPSSSEDVTSMDLIIEGGASQYFGFSITEGDWDGDGVTDIAVGAKGASSSAGAAYVFLGNTSRVTGTIASSDADASHTGAASSQGGYALDGRCDIDGDGYDDLVVSSYAYSSNRGLGSILFDPITSSLLASAPVTVVGNSTSDYFGTSVICIPDMGDDAGAKDEILFGVPFAASGRGEADLFLGDTLGTSGAYSASDADAVLTGNSASSYLGYGLGSGDVTADGYGDLLVGLYYDDVPGTNYGQTILMDGLLALGYLTILSTDDDTEYTTRIQGTSTAEGSGYAVEAADLDGDGDDDLSIASPFYTGAISNSGRINILSSNYGE